MGNTVILTKQHPNVATTVGEAEAFQISLLGGATGPQRVQEEHGFWDEQAQKAQMRVYTLKIEEPLPFEEARKIYYQQIFSRILEGFVHSRSYNFPLGRFVYRDFSGVTNLEDIELN
jgi:hypothetical protein